MRRSALPTQPKTKKKMLCRLCVKESLCFLNIFDSDGKKLDIAHILERHFWFKPRPDDRISPAICTICWSKVYNFHQFYVEIEEAHSKLSASNVEKEFVREYVGNEFIENDLVKEEFSITPSSTIEPQKEFADPEFIEIEYNAEEFSEAPCSGIRKRKESVELELIKSDVNAKELSGDLCLSISIKNEQNSSFTELIADIDDSDYLNEEYDKLSNDVEHLNRSGDAQDPALLTNTSVKNRKRRKTTKKKLPSSGRKPLKGSYKEISKTFTDASLTICDAQDPALLTEKPTEPITDASLSFCNAQNSALLTNKSTEPVKNRKRLTTTKKNHPILRKKRIKASCQGKKTYTDVSLSTCDAQEPELLTEKSTEPIIDASLLNYDAKEHSENTTKSAKNQKKLTVSEKKIAELRQKRGVKTTCKDDELVKKYIPMRCNECIFDCDDFSLLRNHFRLAHPNTKPYVKCCNRKWLHWMSIVHHAYKHDDPELLKCQECQKDFNDLGTLSRHMLDHHAPEKDQIFICDVCPKKFARKVRLDLHRSTHVPMNERTFICDQCPNSRFGCKTMLLIHNKKVHHHTSFVCHVCAKKIKTKAFFEKHVRLHFEESGPKVKCTVDGCDHWLKDEDCLRLHLRRFHSKNKDKLFTCEVCGGEYKSRASITNHMLRVHPKTTYPCKICNKTFKRPRNLNDHMAQHTGESNYTCLFCTSTFNTHGNYYTHLKKSHPVEYENFLKNKK
ncbi:transcription factor grauzone-like [Rhagoletis pomonella]|uniref:transcription factor grauzone-like n=1 Tax=Rhagoletis pomonella TaxID=28610 RepID=UPI001786F744|nr:transcription factor grauzone-like [Rhagoletis pomonella]XP_036331073.1 transcription factor grauzone-like [Rhagoletis pomonella]